MTSPNRYDTPLGTTSSGPEEISEEDIVGPGTTDPTGEVATTQPAATPLRKADHDVDVEPCASDTAAPSPDGAIVSSGDCIASPIVPAPASVGTANVAAVVTTVGGETTAPTRTATPIPMAITTPVPTATTIPTATATETETETEVATAIAPETTTETANTTETATASATETATATATTTPSTTASATETATATTSPPAPATPVPASNATTGARPPVAPASADHGIRRGPTVSLWVATAMCLAGVVTGFGLARLGASNGLTVASSPAAAGARAQAEPRASEPIGSAVTAAIPPAPPARAATPSSRSSSETRSRSVSRPAPEKKRSTARNAKAPAVAPRSGTGRLEVTAPEGAEIWLDGRRIGSGSTRTQVAEGEHRLEVRHLGAKVGERFRVAPGETWTYAVSPR